MLSSPSVRLLLIYFLSTPKPLLLKNLALCCAGSYTIISCKESQTSRSRIKIYIRKRKKNALGWQLHKKGPFRLNFRKLKMSNYMTCTALGRLDFFRRPTEEQKQWLRDLSHLCWLRMQSRISTSLLFLHF